MPYRVEGHRDGLVWTCDVPSQALACAARLEFEARGYTDVTWKRIKPAGEGVKMNPIRRALARRRPRR